MSDKQVKLTEIKQRENGYSKSRVGPKSVIIPAEWEVTPLNEIASVSGGKRLPKGHSYSTERTDYPYIRVVDFENGSVSQNDLKYIDKETYQEIEKYTISDENVYISIAGTLGIAGTIPENLSGANLTENAAKIHELSGVQKDYLSYYIRSKFGQDEVHRFTVGSTQPKLSLFRLRKLEVIRPPLHEQRKIATVLYTVDRAIEKTEEIESQVRRTQNGIVQETLKCGLGGSDISDTGTKLGEIPTHWEITSIDEIVADEEHSFTDGARYALSSAEIHDEGEARAILLQEVGEGEFNDEDPKFATGEKYEEITHRAIYPGEVVVAKMAEPVARACIVPDKYDKYLLGCADVVRIQTNNEFDSRFLMYCMNSHKVWRQAVAHLRGTGRSRINLENVAELKLPKPPLDEQLEIADALESFDHRIQTERGYRNSLRRIKHSLIQDLLSGTVRTTDTNIQVPEKITQYG